jgi:hypothetical protein
MTLIRTTLIYGCAPGNLGAAPNLGGPVSVTTVHTGLRGPPGPPNTTPISTAPGNTLTLGPDNGLFVQQVWSGTPAW